MQTGSSILEDAGHALAGDGWCVLTGLLTPQQTRALATECSAMHADGQLQPARVGASRAAVPWRGDRTRWFEMAALSAAQQAFVDRIEALRQHLNHSLMLGLVESESHYAVYPPGAGYARHRDRLRHSDARVVSAVFYLNEEWDQRDGGALRIHLADGAYRDVYPEAGQLALFLSDVFEHEVLPTTRTRMSIACWLRRRELGTVPDIRVLG